jgi:hypothetical protein
MTPPRIVRFALLAAFCFASPASGISKADAAALAAARAEAAAVKIQLQQSQAALDQALRNSAAKDRTAAESGAALARQSSNQAQSANSQRADARVAAQTNADAAQVSAAETKRSVDDGRSEADDRHAADKLAAERAYHLQLAQFGTMIVMAVIGLGGGFLKLRGITVNAANALKVTTEHRKTELAAIEEVKSHALEASAAAKASATEIAEASRDVKGYTQSVAKVETLARLALQTAVRGRAVQAAPTPPAPVAAEIRAGAPGA